MSSDKFGRYQIIREIARSNDVVYEAVDASINRRVALKELLLPPNLEGVQKRERVERFYREARAAGSLSHPNIVTIYEAGEYNGRHFIAMEYLEGQTLRNVLEIEGKLTEDKAVDVTRQVCEALSYSHSKGIVHRDIKPDNIQILPTGKIKITDFGIARIMEEPTITANGQVFGTPSYMSPEQVAGKSIDNRSDIFSLGVVLFEILTGRKPFTGDTVVTITYNIMNQDTVIPPTVPPYLEHMIRKSLAKDPNMRYQSASDMAEGLDPASFKDMQQNLQYAPPGNATTSYSRTSVPQFPDPAISPSQPKRVVLPKAPSKPLFSAETKYFINVMAIVVIVCALVISFIWALSAGYQGYLRQAKMQEIDSHIQAGKTYYEQQSYKAAIEEFNKALQKAGDPKVAAVVRANLSSAYTALGNKEWQAGNALQSIAYYKQALIYDPNSANAYVNLGNAYKSVERNNEALAAWEKALQLGLGKGAESIARNNLAVMYFEYGDRAMQQGDMETAVQWWRKALDMAPGTQIGFMAQDRIDKARASGR